jgi:hypothetical protein
MSRTFSLAAEVRKADSPVTLFLQERFPNLEPIANEFRETMQGLPAIVPKATATAATIGAAVDYRLRYYFRETIIQTMDAFRGAQYISGGGSPPTSAMRETVSVSAYGAKLSKIHNAQVSIPRVARDFFDGLADLVQRLRPTRRVLKTEDELTVVALLLRVGPL